MAERDDMLNKIILKFMEETKKKYKLDGCLLYTSPIPRDQRPNLVLSLML